MEAEFVKGISCITCQEPIMYMLILEIKLLPCGSAAHFVTAFVELLGCV